MLDSILDAIVDGVIVINRHGRIQVFSSGAEKIFKYSANEVIGKNVKILMPEPYFSNHDQYIKNFQMTNVPKILGVGREVKARRKNGELFDAQLSVGADNQAHTLYVGIIQDITKRKEVERSLRDVTERMMLATESANIGIWDWNPAHDLLTWDERMFRLYGIQKEAFHANYSAWLALIHPEDRQRCDLEVQKAMASLSEFNASFRVLWPNGATRHIKAHGVIYRDSESQVTRMIGTNWDITQAQLDRIELLKAKEQAELANQAKSDFLANMSHEIRTPLNGVMGILELLLQTELSPHQKEFLSLANQSAQNLFDVVNDILDYSKIEAGKLQVEAMPFVLRELLEDTVFAFSILAHKKGLELLLRLDPALPAACIGDATRVRQVLSNLLSNAIKFTESGQVLLSVSGSENQLCFVVEDTGIGIPEEQQALIFDAFAQADSSSTRRFGGTGLGLAITSRLIELMNGHYHLDSKPGQGTRFHFSLPLKPAQFQAEPLAELAQLKGMKVLIVDDNLANRMILHEILTSWEMKVVLLSSSAETLALLSKQESSNDFHFALIDFNMPDMNGFSLAEKIQKIPGCRNLPMFLLSSTSTGKELEPLKAHTKLFRAFLTKPIRIKQLQNIILQHIFHIEIQMDAKTKKLKREWLNSKALDILLAEDNKVNQVVAIELLTLMGHSVSAVNNGEEAIAKLRERYFDLVLMDLQMPLLDGIETTKRIRSMRSEIQNGNLIVMAMTAHALKGDEDRCLEAGMNDYMSKPIRLEILQSKLLKWFPEKASGNQVLAENEGPSPDELGASEAQGKEPLFNEKLALAAVGSDRKLFQRVIDVYFREKDQVIHDLEQGFREHDLGLIHKKAHRFKGTLGIFRASRVVEFIEKMEIQAGGGQLPPATALVKLLEMVEQLSEELRAFSTD